MSEYLSGFAADIEALINFRKTLGYSKITHVANLIKFDRFCADNYPEASHLTKEMAIEWLEDHPSGVQAKAGTLRQLGKYLTAVGKESFVIPPWTLRDRKYFAAYVFTDSELRALFQAADTIPAARNEPLIKEILPVLLRLIYTCGLRPNEGRALLRKNINFKTGEILITNTKKKKERIVVMSGDMLKLARKYDECRNIFSRHGDYFFPSWNGGALTTSQLGHFFRECWKRANPSIPESELPSVRVYDLRHRFASTALVRWLDNGQPLGAKLPYLRAYMGHSTLNETAYYIHLLPENLVQSAGIEWDAFDEIVPNPLELEAMTWEE